MYTHLEFKAAIKAEVTQRNKNVMMSPAAFPGRSDLRSNIIVSGWEVGEGSCSKT